MNINKQPKRSAGNYHELSRSVAANFYKHIKLENREHRPTNILANFLVGRWVLWVLAYIKYRFWFKHRFLSYTYQSDNGIYTLSSATDNNKIKLALVSDWATDTEESMRIGKEINRREPDYTIHLGDTYYVGDRKEITNNFKPYDSFWPYGKMGSFALLGNHEMYSNGYGFFNELLPWMGLHRPSVIPQKTSYFCLENDHWQIIGLDTGYRSVGIPLIELILSEADLHPEIIKWLKDELKVQQSNKGIILLTHHQYTSAFDKTYPAAARQLIEIFGSRKVLWFWGHEHRLALYGLYKIDNGIGAFGRCIGHGGMPVNLVHVNEMKRGSNIVALDNRPYKNIAGTEVGHNGYVVLELEDHRLKVEYFDEKDLLLAEWWEYDKVTQTLVGKDIIKYHEKLDIVQNIRKAIEP